MTPTLRDVLRHMLSPWESGYITRNGAFVRTPTSDTVVEFATHGWRAVHIPEEVSDYIETKGLLHLVSRCDAFEVVLELRAASGKNSTFLYEYIDLEPRSGAGKRFMDAGFEGSLTGVWGYYMERVDFLRLVNLLQGAGVTFTYDAPPWLEVGAPKEAISAANPSSRRPGDEDARFFGF